MRIRSTLIAFGLALGIVAAANSQVYKPTGGGGSSSITAGTTATSGCGAAGVLFSQSSLVQCDTGFTYAGSGGAVGLTGILALPDTTSTTAGVIRFGGNPFLHDTGSNTSVYLGNGAGAIGTSVGVNNVVIGQATGSVLSSGHDNTFVGRFAGGGISTTNSNVAIGSGALSATGAAASNVAVGTSSLGAATGNNNVGIGFQAGNSIVGGTGNVVVGFGSTPGITTGTNNTILGANVTGLSTGLASAVVIAANGIKADFGVTNAGWSFNGAIAATLAAAIGTNVVCNTPGTQTALTVQVSATGCAASSARFKEGIASLDKGQALADVLRFQPVSYTYKPEFNMGTDRHIGFTAEQIGSVDPQWITYENDGVTPHAVKYNEMAPLLAAAIQALKADNDNLRAELEDLKRRVR